MDSTVNASTLDESVISVAATPFDEDGTGFSFVDDMLGNIGEITSPLRMQLSGDFFYEEIDSVFGYDPADLGLDPEHIEKKYKPVPGEDLYVTCYGAAFSCEGASFEGDCSICGEDLTTKAALRTFCGHEFHEDCLQTSINGIQEYSSKCPNCRYRFCDRRPRESVDEDEIVTEAEAEAEEERMTLIRGASIRETILSE